VVKRTAMVLAFFIMMGQGAIAGDQPGGFHQVSCSVVRLYVAKYSAEAAESYARSRGATDADIQNARRCLNSGPLQTASVIK
jgi:hypothetical protein